MNVSNIEKQKQQKQHEEAQAQVDDILNQTRPKNFREGFRSGIGNIVSGAVGAVGVAVVAPVAGMTQGAQKGGVVGGTVGLLGGVVAGAIGAVAVGATGAVSGVVQIGRGVAATPKAITAPRKGKWWDEHEGRWVETNLSTEAEKLKNIPDDDQDILGKIRSESQETPVKDIEGVFERYYYDVLEVEPNVEHSRIKRQYYVLARKYHPDKVGKDDLESADKFKEIAEAYQVLSDERLRKVYDKEGREGLSPDRTSVTAGVPKIDPEILFAFLFGSDKFKNYIGTLAMAISASIEDSENVTLEQAKIIQNRRCTRLAIFLAEKLESWITGDHDAAMETWKAEADELVNASYGLQLLHTIGKIYTLAAVQFLGSLDSGIGMPGISKWAKAQKADIKKRRAQSKDKMGVFKAGIDVAGAEMKLAQEIENATTDEEREKIIAHSEDQMADLLLNMLWTTTVIDITNTLHQTCQMLLFDQSVKKEVRKERGHGLKKLGEFFSKVEAPQVETKNAKDIYEEATLAAMLDTVAKKENAAYNSSVV